MSQEHQPQHHERNEQAAHELESAAREQMERLRHHENSPEHDQERRAEAAREAIHHQEQAPEPQPAPETENHAPDSHRQLLPKLNFQDTMRSMQRHLSPASRTFSKIIHTPAVEKTSEALEQTVSRPSVTLGATWTALIVGGLAYLVARHYGYHLSGSELLFSFLVGGIIGILGEGLFRAFKRH
jgi:hypothetical protein